VVVIVVGAVAVAVVVVVSWWWLMYVDELEGDCNAYVDTRAMSRDVCRTCRERLEFVAS
jgi:multidrug resistance efflux pump